MPVKKETEVPALFYVPRLRPRYYYFQVSLSHCVLALLAREVIRQLQMQLLAVLLVPVRGGGNGVEREIS